MDSPLPVTQTHASVLLLCKCQNTAHAAFGKNPQRLPNIYNWTCIEMAVPLPSFHRPKLCVWWWWDCMWAALSTYGRPPQQANPALFHRAEVPKCLDPKQAFVRSALPEEKALSEAAEHQQSQRCCRTLLRVPAVRAELSRINTLRLISQEISLNTFSLLYHAEEHQEIYYILLEK